MIALPFFQACSVVDVATAFIRQGIPIAIFMPVPICISLKVGVQLIAFIVLVDGVINRRGLNGQENAGANIRVVVNLSGARDDR